MTREYEPDDPNFTPRISAVLHEDGSFCLSILKRIDGRCLREFFAYEGCDEGKGYFLSTYQGPGSPLPSFQGEPLPIDMPEPTSFRGAPDFGFLHCAELQPLPRLQLSAPRFIKVVLFLFNLHIIHVGRLT